MMISCQYKIFLFFIILSVRSVFADTTTSGLYFYSYEVNKENRTSLYIPVPNVISSSDGFSMSFEAKIRNEKQNFGYIFRLIDSNNTNMDLVISDLKANEVNHLSLIANGKVIIQFTKEEILLM
jgi:hypothetical protein